MNIDFSRAIAHFCAGLLLVLHGVTALAADPTPTSPWRLLDPANTLYMDLEGGRVVIELAPQFAPNHAANVKALVRAKYFDQQRINRVQDNFVTQWGDPNFAGPLGEAKRTLPGEFTRSAQGLPFVPLADPDTYAPQTGFVDGFPAARESATGEAWAVHCYGMVGVGRDNASDSGGGTELYAVNGHAPRQLDRNITIVGRVVQGMDLLATLPRGKGSMGFYENPSQHTVIKTMRVAADLPEAERIPLEAMRTDSPEFAKSIEARRNRKDEWYKVPAGKIDVCNVPLTVRRVRPR
ncbi:MAG TPA: peptidylprolyl isomerase [Steroidobacteraceae bacterium]|nr:peptidylprolyl isomerase [Steroidobacteraceae bacterium]